MSDLKRILIIDDEEEIRQSLQEMLSEIGHTIHTARNGKEGLRVLSANTIDLVILDIFMPEKDGIETIREIREQFPDLKIIAQSGDMWRDFLLKTMKALGATKILEKPYTMDQLLELINSN